MFVNNIVNYCGARILFHTKMLKETEAKETRLFCYIFIIGGISIGKSPPPPGYVYASEEPNGKTVCSWGHYLTQCFAELRKMCHPPDEPNEETVFWRHYLM